MSALAQLRLAPPPWGVFWSVLAAAVLAVEAAALLLHCRRLRGKLSEAVLYTLAALLAGPLMVLAGLFYGVTTASTEHRFRGWGAILVGLRGTLLLVLGWAAWYRPIVGGILTVAAGGMLWSVRAYRRTTAPLSPRVKLRLLLLRACVIAIVLLWVLRPMLLHTFTREVPMAVLIGLDRSASMQRQDMPSNYRNPQPSSDEQLVSRVQALRDALDHKTSRLEDLAARAELRWFAFDDKPILTTETRASAWRGLLGRADGQATAIGDGAQAAFNPLATSGKPVAAVVLFTDGCNNLTDLTEPETFAARMSAREVPLLTIGVGSPVPLAQTRGLTVRTTGAAQEVTADRQMRIQPEIEAIGLEGRTIRVTCRFGEEALEPQTRDITSDRSRESFTFWHIPVRTGFHRLVVSAEVLGEEPRNLGGVNSLDQLVQVTDRGIAVLYIEGRFRYEGKYIARAMGTSDRLSLDRRVLTGPLRSGGGEGDRLEDWLRYDAILFGDVAPQRFTEQQLEHLKTAVGEYGKGFAMIGGRNSFGPWSGTPLAGLLPITPSLSEGQIDEPVRPLPTEVGREHPLMRIGPDNEPVAETWLKLDPLPGANRLGGIKSIAEVLAHDEQGRPMIVVQPYGKGRSMAVAFDTTWRWVLSPEDTAGVQRRFWTSVAMFLANPRGNVWIHTNRTTYDFDALERGRQNVEITAGVENPLGQPALDVHPNVTLTGPDGTTRPLELTRRGPVLTGMLPPPLAQGDYLLRIEAELEEKTLTAEQAFRVIRRDREAADVLANFELLEQMAGAGPGEFQPLRRWPDVIEKLWQLAAPKKEIVTEEEDLLAPLRWLLIAMLVGLLTAEWILRKRNGLV